MKYIKLYEEIRTPNLKKYFIWDGDDQINILENSNIIEKSQVFSTKTFLKVCHLYRYNLENNKLEKIDVNSKGCTTGIVLNSEDFDEHKWRILYQSNNLRSCLSQLKIFVSAKKYNL